MKLIIEEPIELTGKAIKPTIEMWVARDNQGLWWFKEKPYMSRGWWYATNFSDFGDLPDFWKVVEVEEGECKKVRITFEVIEK